MVRDIDRLTWSADDVRATMRALAAEDPLLDIQAAEQVTLSMQALAGGR